MYHLVTQTAARKIVVSVLSAGRNGAWDVRAGVWLDQYRADREQAVERLADSRRPREAERLGALVREWGFYVVDDVRRKLSRMRRREAEGRGYVNRPLMAQLERALAKVG